MGVAKKKQGMEIQGGTKVFLQFKKRGKVFEACLDGCQAGVIAPGNGLPMIEETMDNHVNRSTCGPLFGFEMRRRAPTY